MARTDLNLGRLYPLAAATVVSLAVYFQQAQLLLLKVGEVFGGVFDTTVPAYPLAGMFFVLLFLALRRSELADAMAAGVSENWVRAAGLAVAVAPLPIALFGGPQLSASYAFAGVALVCSWVGVVAAIRPSTFYFLLPYLLLYLLTVGLVGALTASFGDPLAVAVAAVANAITAAAGLPVQWSSVYIGFVSAQGQQVSLVITQECSGIASMSIFLLVLGLMHLDLKASWKTSAVFAVGGSALFLLLNSLRVVGLIAGGIYVSTGFMWSLHGWLGYVLYIVGYALLLVLYMGRKRGPPRPDGGAGASGQSRLP